MGPLDLLNHVLNFAAPAMWMAVFLPLATRILMKKGAVALASPTQATVNFGVALVVLLLGLWIFGRDGKMLTYTGMVLACATSQWVMLRGWRA